MNKFIDLHNHVLPIDDGAQDWDDSIEMLYCAVESQISTVFVTPHIIPGGKYFPSSKKIKTNLSRLKKIALEKELQLNLKVASEFQINRHCMEAINHKSFLTYENTDYLLVEFTRTILYTPLLDQALDELVYQGHKIIIAHPERYFESVEEAIDICLLWVKRGYYLQINRTSIIHSKIKLHKKIAYKLLELNCVHLIASDAHHTVGIRLLKLDDVYSMLVKVFGLNCANTIMLDNPKSLIQNNPLKKTRIKKGLFFYLSKLF